MNEEGMDVDTSRKVEYCRVSGSEILEMTGRGGDALAGSQDDQQPRISESYVDDTLAKLKALSAEAFDHYVKGREGLYRWLGHIHVAAAAVDRDPAHRSKLLAVAQKAPGVQEGPEKLANRESVDLFLVLSIGLDAGTKAKKCYWLGALRAAKAAEVPLDVDAFTSWLKEQGGVIAAAGYSVEKKPARKSQPGKSIRGMFSLPDFLEKYADSEKAVVLTIPKPEGFMGDDKPMILFVKGTGVAHADELECQLLTVECDIELIRSAAEIIDGGDVEHQIQHDNAIWTLSRVASELASSKSGKIRDRSGAAFHKAINTLKTDPKWKNEYFAGDAVVDIQIHDMEHKAEILVQNPELPPYDPARYIGNALAGKLTGYEAGEDDAENQKRMNAFRVHHRESKARWQVGKPKRSNKRKSSGASNAVGATLDQFLSE